MDTTFQILCGIAAVILALYYYFTLTFDYWKSRGVRGPRPIPGFGNLKDIVLGKITVGDYITKLYHDYKDEQMFGIFLSRTPVLILKEPDLLKDIIIKDFHAFSDRGHTVHEKAEPLSLNLFSLNPERWRSMRMKMTPMFTSSKLKEMFVLMSDCANQFVNDVEVLASKNEPIECLELTSKYTTDIIGEVFYGIEMNALSDKKSQEFHRIGRNVFHMPWSDYLRNRIKVYWPWLFDILGYILPDTEITTFFISLVVDTIAYRDKHNIVKNDFIDMLRKIKKNWNTMGDIEYTDSLLAAQAFIFFAAGYETSSTTMTNALYELALNQKIQNRLREEIDQKYLKHNNLTYDNIKEMDYLDKVVKETLRKYPPGMFNMRRSTTSYTFNNTDITIPNGQLIWIPMFALHHDPCVYPKPDVFNPERFNEETVRNRHPMFFLPFGDGPRNCIGIRVGIYQTKIGLIKILRNFKIEPCERTEVPYVRNEKTFVVTPKNGIYLRFIKINRA